MKLEEICALWAQDSELDESQMASEARNVSKLHHKYRTIMLQENLALTALDAKRRQLEMTLDLYYRGKLDGKEIGREPFQLIVTADEKVKRHVLADKEMVELNLRYAAQEEKVLYLRDVVSSINWRNQQVKNWIEIQKFMNGIG